MVLSGHTQRRVIKIAIENKSVFSFNRILNNLERIDSRQSSRRSLWTNRFCWSFCSVFHFVCLTRIYFRTIDWYSNTLEWCSWFIDCWIVQPNFGSIRNQCSIFILSRLIDLIIFNALKYFKVVYEHRLFTIPYDTTAHWIIAAFGADFCYYWAHR